MYKKIAIVGSHGTGKSTLLSDLTTLSELSQYKFITESARNILARSNLKLEGLTKDNAFHFEFECIAYQAIEEGSAKNDMFISDRCFFDVEVYSKSMLDNKLITENQLETINDLCITFKKDQYDLILFVPIEFSMSEQDSVDNRNESEEYRKHIEQQLYYNLLQYKLEHQRNLEIIFVKGSREERVEKVIKILTTY